jgi:hypothetical protein
MQKQQLQPSRSGNHCQKCHVIAFFAIGNQLLALFFLQHSAFRD